VRTQETAVISRNGYSWRSQQKIFQTTEGEQLKREMKSGRRGERDDIYVAKVAEIPH
jgi:hypothetical protein